MKDRFKDYDMTVAKLHFVWPEYDCNVKVDKTDGRIRFIIKQHGELCGFELDRNQADMLRLYLTEHLK